ncbi:DUF5694 domain-containing protein [Pontibacter sp. SGAir0037]|uniref:DUF5694 domain-containing protein n=1 Tax=Pontibacter sp. SGAir0037 TaxID=2571030 RepID=UPI0010CD16CB|nr:DUF5694 domain-containing protein [Pontibacter sp. SGAir0037]QCR22324.1 hypothetical protein C1N53_08230 [Pontibacter sp. SGAir0037]
MKFFLTVTILLLYSYAALAQAGGKAKVKIALLGTMHFTPSTQDAYSNEELKLTAQKKKELEHVIVRLAAFKPDQICIEVPVEKQENTDKQYRQYLAGKYKLELNEIDLLGFQTAKRLQLPKLTCVNYLGKFDTQPSQAAALQHGQQAVLESTDTYAKAFVQEMNEKEKSLSMADNLIYLNNQSTLNKNLAMYTNYFIRIGKGSQYEGTELVAEWYKTNLHIYTNILRQVKPTDKAILVIYGQGHIPILKHLFESNPDFEVVEVSTLLGK